MSWISDQEKFKLVNYIKETDIFKSLYKLIVLIYVGVNKTTYIKLLLGGNYHNLIAQAETRGYLKRKPGGVLVLTPEGERLAKALYNCMLGLKSEREKREEGEN